MSLFNEKWIPFSLAELGDDESLPIDDADAYVPYLLEKWPPGGKPHRVEHYLPEGSLPPGRRKPAPGTDGWVVFRLPPRERPVDPEAPVIDWASVLTERLRDPEAEID